MDGWQTTLYFVVHGVPAPQGSKTRTRYGMREDNPRTEPWRNAVAAAASKAMLGQPPLTGPVRMTAVFRFPRPRSHYRTGRHAGQLRPSAPVHHGQSPDLDKLCRAIFDAISGIAIRDDALIAELVCVKRWGEPSAMIGLEIAT